MLVRDEHLRRLGDNAPESLRRTVEKAFDLAEAFAFEAAAVRGDKHFSELGRREKLAQAAQARAATLAAMRAEVESQKAQMAAARDKMRPAQPNRSDVSGELRRAEMRSFLRSQEAAERARLVLSDPSFREAALDAPDALSGLGADLREQAFAISMQEQHGEALKRLDAEEAALEEVGAAVAVAEYQVQRAARGSE